MREWGDAQMVCKLGDLGSNHSIHRIVKCASRNPNSVEGEEGGWLTPDNMCVHVHAYVCCVHAHACV